MDKIKLLELTSDFIGIKYSKAIYFEEKLINYKPIYGLCTDLPPLDEIKNIGINCLGLINLIRLKLGKIMFSIDLKYVDKTMFGCVGYWHYKLNKYYLKHIPKYDSELDYDCGTLIYRKSCNLDPGHFAILLDKNTIIHSYTNQDYIKIGTELVDPGVIIEEICIINRCSNINCFQYAIPWHVWTTI